MKPNKAVLYQFDVVQGQLEQFLSAWEEMTELICQYESGLGSRLHKKDEFTFIAYAQWPDEDTWRDSGGKLPEKAQEVRGRMRKACSKVEILMELEVVSDLLK